MRAGKQGFFPSAFSAAGVKLDVCCPAGPGMNPFAGDYLSDNSSLKGEVD